MRLFYANRYNCISKFNLHYFIIIILVIIILPSGETFIKKKHIKYLLSI